MKRYHFIIMMCLSISLFGCGKEAFTSHHSPGDAVEFGAEESTSMTKTSYSGKTFETDMERINWIDGDAVRIVCAQGVPTSADYSVTGTEKDGKYHHGTLSSVTESMKWGDTENHTFYGVYPVPDGTALSISGNVVTATLPSDQSFSTGKVNENGDTYYGDMGLAYMTAAATGKLYETGPIVLTFNPIVTTFYVTIYNDYPSPKVMNLQRIILSSANAAMTGTYRATLSPDGSKVFTYAESGWGTLVTRTDANSVVSYDWDGAAIPNGGSVTVAMFALPQNIGQVSLTVVTGEGVSTLELKQNNDWISFTGGRKHNISNLGVKEWTYDIDVTPTTLNYTYSAGDAEPGTFSVRSTKTIGENTYPTPWKAQYWTDADADGVEDSDEWTDIDAASLPAFLAAFTAADSPSSTTYESHTAKMTHQSLQSHEDRLRTAWIDEINAASRVLTGGGSTPRVDLSKWNFISHTLNNRTTANCYIVQGPGEYCFPMAYGNAIDVAFANKSDNSDAYKPNVLGADALNQFRNHLRNDTEYLEAFGPASSRIRETMVSRRSTFGPNCMEVGVLWYDFLNGQNCITNLSTYEENTYSDGATDRMITFTVDPVTVSVGNAVIYVKDTNLDAIAWSWHIWITDQTLTPVVIQNSAYTGFALQPINLGWADDTYGLYYPPRTGKIRFVCVEHESTVSPTLSLVQSDHEDESTSGFAPYYEWGRKDPINAGAELVNDEPHHIYYSIRNPEKFLSAQDVGQSEYDWTDNDYANLWRASNTSKGDAAMSALVQEKTVYDPCPRGYKVPAGTTWNGMNLGGASITGKGRYFVTIDGGWNFFPAMGYINGADGTVTNKGDSGLYWLDIPSTGTARNSYCLNYSLTGINAPGYTNRGHALSVRCEREDTNSVM